MSTLAKLRLGMIGGAHDAFIGAIHRNAAAMDHHFELVCGCFSQKKEKSLETARKLHLGADRVYGDWQEMLDRESQLPAEKRMQVVAIVTPNHLHFPQAMAALQAGFHVACDKPMTLSADQARQLAAEQRNTGLKFLLTHTYVGFPMVQQAKAMVAEGVLGTLNKVTVEYSQGWLYTLLESENQKQASWRSDPAQGGPALSLGDIGVHAANLMETVSGLYITELAADTTALVQGRTLDDDSTVMLRLQGGVKGHISASQASAGLGNDLRIRLHGTKAGLEWKLATPWDLKLLLPGQPEQTWTAGVDRSYLHDHVQAMCRLPSFHGEAFIEAFANLYTAFADDLYHQQDSHWPEPLFAYPSVSEGYRGMAFIEACLSSQQQGNTWVTMPKDYNQL